MGPAKQDVTGLRTLEPPGKLAGPGKPRNRQARPGRTGHEAGTHRRLAEHHDPIQQMRRKTGPGHAVDLDGDGLAILAQIGALGRDVERIEEPLHELVPGLPRARSEGPSSRCRAGAAPAGGNCRSASRLGTALPRRQAAAERRRRARYAPPRRPTASGPEALHPSPRPCGDGSCHRRAPLREPPRRSSPQGRLPVRKAGPRRRDAPWVARACIRPGRGGGRASRPHLPRHEVHEPRTPS